MRWMPDWCQRGLGALLPTRPDWPPEVRRAHERNRIKRLARESFRLHQQHVGLLDIVVMPKIGIEAVSNADLHQQLEFAWQKLLRQAKKYQKVAVSPSLH